MIKNQADILYEVSWEVCNKIGGIYTVVSSKADITKKHYKHYFLIGPYIKDNADIYFKKRDVLPQRYNIVFDKLKEQGVKCYLGEWQIKGEPSTILIDFSGLVSKKDQIKEELWNNFQIDSLNSAWEFDEPVIWAYAVGMLLDELSKMDSGKKIVAQFHEWLAGLGLLYLKSRNNKKIATVFTTHATMLGRAMAGNGQPIYAMLDSLNPEERAYEYKVQDKFSTEKACAHNADCFTTVSEITGIEAEKILGKKPDVLLLNGLDLDKFPTVEEYSMNHVICREKIRDFLTSHFFPYYLFDINHTMIIFILGRYEFKNKGIDIFIEALGKLNQRLIKERSKRTITVFFWIPQSTFGMKQDVLENKNNYRHVKNLVEFNSRKIMSNIVYDLISRKEISKSNLFTKNLMMSIKKSLIHLRKKGNPPILTHNIYNEQNDPIMSSLLNHGLDNREDNNVKTILYPVYLDGNDGLIDLSYYDTMAGCHLGIFPSYYEPWGYTPLEAAALGVPSITSDLTGYGRFIQNKLINNMDNGIFVLKRFNKNDDEVIEEFSSLLYKFSKRDNHQRAKNKLNAKGLSTLADWRIFIDNYINAHNIALDKISDKK